MENQKLVREQLDHVLQGVAPIISFSRPIRGWLRAIRLAKGISGVKLAKSMGVQPPRIVEMEKGELEGALTIKTLERAAEAMGCSFVYALLPKTGTLQDTPNECPGDSSALSLIEKGQLKLSHITTRVDLVRYERECLDQTRTRVLMEVRKTFLTIKFFRNLHAEILGEIWKGMGQFRNEEIEAKLKSLIENVEYWHRSKSYTGDEAAIRFHHRFLSIRPFEKGDEGVSGLLADLILTRMYRLTPFTWGKKSFKDEKDRVAAYADAIRKADGRIYSEWIKLARTP